MCECGLANVPISTTTTAALRSHLERVQTNLSCLCTLRDRWRCHISVLVFRKYLGGNSDNCCRNLPVLRLLLRAFPSSRISDSSWQLCSLRKHLLPPTITTTTTAAMNYCNSTGYRGRLREIEDENDTISC